jgi:hypothetical protein
MGYHSRPLYNDFVQLPPISQLDILKAIKHLRPSKSVGCVGICGFIIKDCSAVFVPLLKYIFDLSLSQERFSMQWKKVVILPVLKNGNSSSVSNYRPIFLLNNFSKVFAFVMYHHVSDYFKHKFNPNQCGFPKANSATTNLVSYLCVDGLSDGYGSWFRSYVDL